MSDEVPVTDILNTIGDEQARTVLAAIAGKPSSVNDLSERLDMSKATIYRRIDTLSELDFITERTLVADDGNHYKEFKCKFKSTVVLLEDSSYDAHVVEKENLQQGFTSLWNQLAKTE